MKQLTNSQLLQLGQRLREARLRSRLTQDGAASQLNLARTTLVAIENGKRALAGDELSRIASLYRVAITDLLDPDRPSLSLSVDFRHSRSGNHATHEAEAVRLVSKLAESALEIEKLVNYRPSRPDFPSVGQLEAVSVLVVAEDTAQWLRSRLGIGLGPIQDIYGLLESEMGIRIFERPLGGPVSGCIAHAPSGDAFILVNSLHPYYRRRVTVAHELGHLIGGQQGVQVDFDGVDGNSQTERLTERFCTLFGMAFLMPAASVRKHAAQLRHISGKFTVRELVLMSLHFDVSLEAMARRMEALKLLPEGSFDQLRAKGLKSQHQAEVRKEVGLKDPGAAFTSRTLLLALTARERGLLSEQQIAEMLELDLLTVRNAMDEDNLAESGIELELVHGLPA
jgi:Zn-dependent peptidase ImmA (M78 family)/transcriptional regulator with XRE-family HTH domain